MNRLFAILWCALLCAGLCACAPTPASFSPSAPEELSGTIVYSSHRTDFQNSVLPQYVAEFNQKYPNVIIEIDTVKDYFDTMKIKMATNDLPDIWSVHPTTYTRAQLQQYNRPLDDLPYADDFTGIDQFTGNDGRLYAMPTGLVAVGIVYNKKIFTELDLTVPNTLTQFLECARAIKASGRVGLATVAKAKWPLQYYWQDVCKMISGDPELRNKLALEDEPFTPDSAVVRSYGLLKRFVDSGIVEDEPLSVDCDWEPTGAAFRRGEIGMMLLGSWYVPQAIGDALTLEDVGFFPFPYDDTDGQRNVTAGPDIAMAVAKNTRCPEAAMAFFNFLMEDKYLDFAQRCGLLSARRSVKVDLSYVREFNSFRPNYLEEIGDTAELQEIITRTELDYLEIAQEIVSGKSPEGIFDDLNARWKAARS